MNSGHAYFNNHSTESKIIITYKSVEYMTIKFTPRLGFEPKHSFQRNRSRAGRVWTPEHLYTRISPLCHLGMHFLKALIDYISIEKKC